MNDQMLRPPEVMERTGLSRTTLWRRVRAGSFPAPKELGENSIGWPAAEIDKWCSSRPRRTYGAAEPYSPPEAAA
jgi:prophage regulatory protein